jgi:hypothetical protein
MAPRANVGYARLAFPKVLIYMAYLALPLLDGCLIAERPCPWI